MNATEKTTEALLAWEAMRALLACAAEAEAQGDRETYARALRAAISLAEGRTR